MLKNKDLYWIWGQFSFEDSIYLSSLQEEVLLKFDGPRFEPHVTLSGPFDNIDNFFEINIKKLCKKEKDIDLKINSYKYEENIYTSFYISIDICDNLELLRKKIFKIRKYNINPDFYKPHISLAYGEYDELEKIKLINTLPILKEVVKMKNLSIVRVNENKNIWEVLNRFNFES